MSGSQVLILSGLEAVQNQIWFHPTRGSFHFIPQGACEKTVFQSLIFFLQRRVCLMGWSNRERGVATSHSQSHKGSAKKKIFRSRLCYLRSARLDPRNPRKKGSFIPQGVIPQKQKSTKGSCKLSFLPQCSVGRWPGCAVGIGTCGSPWVYVAH